MILAAVLLLSAGCDEGAGVGCLTALLIVLGASALGLAFGWAAVLRERGTRSRKDSGDGARRIDGCGGCGGGDAGGGCGAGCGGGCGGCGG